MVEPAWERVQLRRASEQVLEQIERLLMDGQLHAGDRLPSERELASLLEVSRPSLREAVRVLEALGVVTVRRGSEGGMFLASEPGSVFTRLLTMQVALGQFTQEDILGTRLALEVRSCEHAARSADADDLTELAAILDAMDDPGVTTADFNRLDAAFHLRIAGAGENALMANLMQALRAAIHQQMIDAYARLEDWRETAVTVRAEHREILAAIRDGRSDEVGGLVEHHITSFYAALRAAA